MKILKLSVSWDRFQLRNEIEPMPKWRENRTRKKIQRTKCKSCSCYASKKKNKNFSFDDNFNLKVIKLQHAKPYHQFVDAIDSNASNKKCLWATFDIRITSQFRQQKSSSKSENCFSCFRLKPFVFIVLHTHDCFNFNFNIFFVAFDIDESIDKWEKSCLQFHQSKNSKWNKKWYKFHDMILFHLQILIWEIIYCNFNPDLL